MHSRGGARELDVLGHERRGRRLRVANPHHRRGVSRGSAASGPFDFTDYRAWLLLSEAESRDTDILERELLLAGLPSSR